MQIHQTILEVVRGSVLEIEADTILNAANKKMRGGGALDGAIHRAAGKEMLRELEIVAPNGADNAEIVVTRAYNLPQKWVFHVAGPYWNEKKAEQCDHLLARCFRGALEEAQNRGLESIAVPSISTGVYRFPIERAAPIALGTGIDFLQQNPQTMLRRVTFAMFGSPEFHHFERALKLLESSHQAD